MKRASSYSTPKRIGFASSLEACLMALTIVFASTLIANADTILSEDFQGAFPGSWAVGDSNASGTPAYWKDVSVPFGTIGRAADDSSWIGYCAGYGYGGSSSSPTYQDNMDGYMSRTINLSGYSNATLTFWYAIPSIESCCDRLEVYIDSTRVWYTGTANPGYWNQVTVDLSSYVGSSHTLKFNFHSDVSFHYEGAYLDVILVSGTPIPDTATIYNARWSNPVDNDGDGYGRSARLNWDPDVADGSGTLTVFEKVYYKLSTSGTWTLLYTSGTHTITDWNTSDSQYVDVTGYSHGLYDWKIEVYRSGQPTPDYTCDPSHDSDLNDYPMETSAEDVPPSLVDAACYVSPTSLTSGARITVYYSIYNPDSVSATIGLGCSIRKNGTSTWIDNSANNAYRSCPSGYSTQYRYFDVPTDATGSYDVAWSLWQTIGSGSSWYSLTKLNQFTVYATATIYNAWWSNEVDNDGDGYKQSARLNWDPNVFGSGSLSVYERIYWKLHSSSTWNLITTNSPHTIAGQSTGDSQYHDYTSGSHDEYDWKIEIYRSDQSLPDYIRSDANDTDLNDYPMETECEDALRTLVFNPNPVNRLNNTNLTDRNDADAAVPDSAYEEVDLTHLDPPSGGLYHLSGDYAVMQDIEGPANTPPTSSCPQFRYHRNADAFEEVMCYYHITRNQEYIQSLGFTNINNRAHKVDAHGFNGLDNSHYVGDPVGSGYLAFGDGGVDDAEDADIILHEYGHSIQDNTTTGRYFGSNDRGFGDETGAMAEGFGDYWACSCTYTQSVANGYPSAYMGEWDMTSQSSRGYMRRVDTNKRYPCDMDRENYYVCSEIWSACLWDLFRALHKEVTDKIVLKSHSLVIASPNFQEGAEAILSADGDLYGGSHATQIRSIFEARGIYPDYAGVGPPVIEVTPPSLDFGSVEIGTDAGLSFTIKNIGAEALSGSASVAAPFWIGAGTYYLNPCQSQQITVWYTPNWVETNHAVVSLSGGFGTTNLPVTGSGHMPPVISVTPPSADFGNVAVGDAVERTFAVWNTGGWLLSGSATATLPFSVVSGSPYNVPPNGYTNVIVRYQPSSDGSNASVVQFSGGVGASRPVSGSAYYRPAIGANPQSVSVILGGTATFTATVASGTPPLSYQWLFNGNLLQDGGSITGATSLTLQIANAQPTNEGEYSFRVTNPVGFAVSEPPATLTVLVPPHIIQQPASCTNDAGTTATFTVNASGTPPLRYQWQKGGVDLINIRNVSGANSNTLTISNVLKADEGNYRVVITNVAGSAVSGNAMLTVIDPVVTTQPASRMDCVGTTEAFTVTAAGTAPLTYHWQKGGVDLINGGNVSAADSTTLTLTNLQQSDSGDYRVVVTNSVGSAISQAATLTVLSQPVIIQQPVNLIVPPGGNATFSVTATGIAPFSYQWYFKGTNR